MRHGMTIEAGKNGDRIALVAENVVIHNPTGTHHKGISVSAVDTARLLRSVLLLCFGRASRRTRWIVWLLLHA